jgi:hypothetical protein
VDHQEVNEANLDEIQINVNVDDLIDDRSENKSVAHSKPVQNLGSKVLLDKKQLQYVV